MSRAEPRMGCPSQINDNCSGQSTFYSDIYVQTDNSTEQVGLHETGLVDHVKMPKKVVKIFCWIKIANGILQI